MEPYRGPDGSLTTLQNSVFSTVPGSPAWIAKASVNRVNLPQYGMTWEYGPERNPVRVEDGARWMTTIASALERPRVRAPRPVLLAIAVGWALAVTAELTGTAKALHHDTLIQGGSAWAALVFLVAWQAMVAAMMLPSALPLIRLFEAVSDDQERHGGCVTPFLGGYGAVWTAFGALALLGDSAVHHAVDAFPGSRSGHGSSRAARWRSPAPFSSRP